MSVLLPDIVSCGTTVCHNAARFPRVLFALPLHRKSGPLGGYRWPCWRRDNYTAFSIEHS